MFGWVSKQDIESAAEVEQRSSPRSLQRRSAHCLRRSYFSEYSFARFRLCFVCTAPTAGGTEQCSRLALCVLSGAFGLACLLLAAHIPMAFLSRQSLKAMLSLGKGFLTEQEAMKHAALWVKEDLEIERKGLSKTIQSKSNDFQRKTLEVIQQQNSLRRRLF